MESSFAQMDIFFLVTTIVVVAVGVLAIVLLVYAIKFLRDARLIARAIKDEMTEIIDDIDDFRKDVKGKADKFSGLLGALTAASFIRKFLKDK
jgi:signal transduction histidine kinase